VTGPTSALVDRAALLELVHRFTWATDHGDWDGLRPVLSDPFHFDSGSATGRAPEAMSPEQFIADLRPRGARFDAAEHLVGNGVVDALSDGTRAVVRTYVHVTLVRNAVSPPFWRMGGLYRADAVLRDGRWLMERLVVTKLWEEGNPQVIGS
jgi:hypothetical protein